MAYEDDEVGDTPKGKLLEQAKRRFRVAADAEQKQRQREKDDLRFQVPELQWDDAAKRARLGMGNDGVPQPARPVLSISKIDQPIHMVLNQERAAHLGVSIQPLSADAETETAAILEGIYRRIERDSQAHVARSWAFSRAVVCGRGYYRVNTQYDETSDNPFDQTITIERILNQDAVYLDPAAQKPDFSDGSYGFITSWVSRADFKAEFPDAMISSCDDSTFESYVTEAPDWVRGSGEEAAVLVVEYFYVEKRFEEIKAKAKNLSRKRELRDVKWCKLTAWEILEEGDWNGQFIPIIPVIGKELHRFDEERRWVGLITNAKDAQRLYNYAASSAVELASLEPKAPWIIAEGQIEGYEAEWQQANVRNLPTLTYKPTTIAGEPAPPPQRVQVDVSRLGPSMQLLQQADQFIQATTATHDPSLGRTNPRERSGRAIMALQQQGEEGNSHFMHNLADISMTYEAKVILDLIPKIYDREARLVRTLDEEGESDTVLVNAPFVRDQDKRPVPAPPPPPPGMGPGGPPMGGPPMGPGPGAMPPGMPPGGGMMPQPKRPEVKTYDLRKGIYSVAVSIGKTRQSALQEGAEEIGQILQSQPQLMPLIGPLYFRYRDFPGAKEIADLLAKMRDKQFPGLADDEDEGPTIEQVKAKADQMGQQMQMMQQQMAEMGKALETEQLKMQAQLQKAQIDAQAGLQKAQMDNAAKVQVAQIQAESKQMLETLMAKLEAMEKGRQRGHESVEAEKDREQEALMAVAVPALEWKAANETPLEERSEV